MIIVMIWLYNIYFRTNIFGEKYEPFVLPDMGLIELLLLIHKARFDFY